MEKGRLPASTRSRHVPGGTALSGVMKCSTVSVPGGRFSAAILSASALLSTTTIFNPSSAGGRPSPDSSCKRAFMR